MRRAQLVTAADPAASPTDPRLCFCRHAASLPNQNGESETVRTNYMRVRQQSRAIRARGLRRPRPRQMQRSAWTFPFWAAQVGARPRGNFEHD
ncbi:hypothetical protein OAO87_01560 [bacterium]|nr:hypothetical protein [bacterium]